MGIRPLGAAGYCSGLGPHPYGTWLTSSLPQGLYNQTVEAMDHMLQCFMMQNPTTNELYFLLSVRAAGSGGEGWNGGEGGMRSSGLRVSERALHRTQDLASRRPMPRGLEHLEGTRRHQSA